MSIWMSIVNVFTDCFNCCHVNAKLFWNGKPEMMHFHLKYCQITDPSSVELINHIKFCIGINDYCYSLDESICQQSIQFPRIHSGHVLYTHTLTCNLELWGHLNYKQKTHHRKYHKPDPNLSWGDYMTIVLTTVSVCTASGKRPCRWCWCRCAFKC